MACMLGTKYINYKSHQLTLNVKDIFKEDSLASNLVEAFYNTMSSVKRKNRNAAILQNLTDLLPVLDNKTCL